jgi:hypothetical protein
MASLPESFCIIALNKLNKMRKNLLFIMFLCLATASINAQFTLRVAGGYAWPGLQTSENIQGPIIDPLHPDIDALGPLANITDTITTNGKFNPATYKPIKGSYGKGMNFSLGFGYTLKKYFNFELGVSYLKSATLSCDQNRQLTIFTGLGYSYIPAYLHAHITSDAFGVSISPAFTVQAPIKKSKFMPYARIGLSMPIYGGLTDHITITQNSGIPTLVQAPYFLGAKTNVTLQTQGTVSLGVNWAVGVKYNVLPYLSVFAEINGQYLTTRAKSSKITQWDTYASDTSAAVSQIGNRGVYRTQFTFVNQLGGNSNNAQYNSNYSTSKPKDDIGPTGPFSNLGLNIGLTFNLSKKTLKKKDADDKKPAQ